jgi:hypothetical protein
VRWTLFDETSPIRIPMLVYVWLLLTISCRFSLCLYDLVDVAAGTKLSANDHLLVTASNTFSNFAIVINPFMNATTNQRRRCSMRYNTTDSFVYSVAVIGIAKGDTTPNSTAFAFAAEMMSTRTPYVCVATITISTCDSNKGRSPGVSRGFQ